LVCKRRWEKVSYGTDSIFNTHTEICAECTGKKNSFSCPIVRESSLWCDGVSKIVGHVKTCAEGTNKKEKKPHLGFKQQQMQTV